MAHTSCRSPSVVHFADDVLSTQLTSLFLLVCFFFFFGRFRCGVGNGRVLFTRAVHGVSALFCFVPRLQLLLLCAKCAMTQEVTFQYRTYDCYRLKDRIAHVPSTSSVFLSEVLKGKRKGGKSARLASLAWFAQVKKKKNAPRPTGWLFKTLRAETGN
jgi:hypothetical protein